MDKLARLDRLQCCEASGHLFKQFIYFSRSGANDQDCDLPASKVLLILYVFVDGNENVERPLGQPQQLSVFLARKPNFGNGRTFMSVGRERSFQETGYTLVKQKPHLRPANTTALASSSAATASSRVTVGNSSRN